MHRYKDLEFWKKSKGLCVDLYSVTEKFPEVEKFGITYQIRKSAVSIVSNIAEGSSRRSNRDFFRFLEIATGSAYELEAQLIIANEIGYLNDEKYGELSQKLISTIQMMSKFKLRLNG